MPTKRVFDRVRNVVAEPRTYIAPNIFNIGPQTGKETGVKKALGMMGNGDHGGGPDSGQYATVLKQNGSDGVQGATVEMATITEYFDSVRETEDLSKVRTVEGEMYFENHRGTYTSWARVKEYNRKNEILAEKLRRLAPWQLAWRSSECRE